MTDHKLSQIIDSAAMIVGGYAFTRMDNGNIRVIDLNEPHHASVIRPNGEVIETSMDDVETDIVEEYWQRNKKYMEEENHAEVL